MNSIKTRHTAYIKTQFAPHLLENGTEIRIVFYKEQTIDTFELTMVIAGWRPELLSSIYKERFVIEQDKIVGFRTKNVYDMPDFRLYNSYLFVDLRIEGLKKENDLKVKMEHILKLIKSEIKE